MNGILQPPNEPPNNGTVSVATFKNKSTGKFFLAVVHTDRNGERNIVGINYPNIDEAKSAAWMLGQQYGAVVLPTRRVRA